MKIRYELTFAGGALARYFPHYRRWHADKASAEAEADRVYRKLRADDLPLACHPYEITKTEEN
jgi:hypothetical protein